MTPQPMRQRILRYTVARTGPTPMPPGARLLHADLRDEQVQVWAEVDEAAMPETVYRHLLVALTGDRVPGGQHVATVQGWDRHGQPLVVHLYDQGES